MIEQALHTWLFWVKFWANCKKYNVKRNRAKPKKVHCIFSGPRKRNNDFPGVKTPLNGLAPMYLFTAPLHTSLISSGQLTSCPTFLYFCKPSGPETSLHCNHSNLRLPSVAKSVGASLDYFCLQVRIFFTLHCIKKQQQQNTNFLVFSLPGALVSASRHPPSPPPPIYPSIFLAASLCGERPSNARLINHAWRCSASPRLPILTLLLLLLHHLPPPSPHLHRLTAAGDHSNTTRLPHTWS